MVKFPGITSTMWAVATRSSESSFELRVGLNAMLEAVKFPGIIADLNSGLTDVDWNALSHFREGDDVVPFNVFFFFFLMTDFYFILITIFLLKKRLNGIA